MSSTLPDVKDYRVMTVMGPIDDEELGSVLMNEHLVCNAFKTKKKKDRGLPLAQPDSTGQAPFSADDPLRLENLATIKTDPFGHAENMTLSSPAEVTAALQGLRHGAILDVTAVAAGRDVKAAQTLSKELDIHVIVGTTPSPQKDRDVDDHEGPSQVTAKAASVEASKQDMDFMEQELRYGLEGLEEDGICAGFIGEIEISSQFTASEVRELKAAAVVQGLTMAPLLVAETTPTRHATQILDHVQACNGVLSRTVLLHMDMYATDLSFLQTLLERGVVLCLDRFTVSAACFDPDQVYPSVTQVVDAIHGLLQINPVFCRQLVLSVGIFMKLQYRKYGGMGYGVIEDYLLPRLKAKGVTQAQIDAILRLNALRLLKWWTPPPEKEKPKEFLPCSVCKKMFEPILGTYYTKYNFTYCGTDCLRVHRLQKFKALE